MTDQATQCPHCGRDKRRAVIGRRTEVPCYWCGLLPSAPKWSGDLQPAPVITRDVQTLADAKVMIRHLAGMVRFSDADCLKQAEIMERLDEMIVAAVDGLKR